MYTRTKQITFFFYEIIYIRPVGRYTIHVHVSTHLHSINSDNSIEQKFFKNKDEFQVEGSAAFNYNPHPVDMTNLTLSREMQNMAERLAENSHDIWAKKKREEIDTCGGAIHSQLVPYDLLTDKEKKKDRERSQEFLKYMQYQGLKLHK